MSNSISEFLGLNSWGKPIHIIKNSDLSKNLEGKGFLTPTPILLDNTIRIYGGIRDSQGQSSIAFAELEAESLNLVRISSDFVLDTRSSNDFDSNGSILGTIQNFGKKWHMLYVGFRKSKKVKFEAHTGLAVSEDNGMTFQPKKRILNNIKTFFGTSFCIEACHWSELDEFGTGKAFLTVGNSWEIIDGKQFPRYETYEVLLKNFELAQVLQKVPTPLNVYRLGRPRVITNHFGQSKLILTGGKRNLDYRPYVFEKKESKYMKSKDKFPISPGDFEFCRIQVSYPASVNYSDQTYIFFNGDNMGEDGTYLIKGKN